MLLMQLLKEVDLEESGGKKWFSQNHNFSELILSLHAM